MVNITSSAGQVIVTVKPLALLYSLTDQEFILSNSDRTRLYEILIITIMSFINDITAIELNFHFFIPVLAQLALVRLGAGVDPYVLTKTLSIREPLATVNAFEIPLSRK
jgi:hypothetical protein